MAAGRGHGNVVDGAVGVRVAVRAGHRGPRDGRAVRRARAATAVDGRSGQVVRRQAGRGRVQVICGRRSRRTGRGVRGRRVRPETLVESRQTAAGLLLLLAAAG